MYNEANNRTKSKGSQTGPPWSFYTLIRKSYCYQLQWKVRQFGPVELLYNFPHIWMTYISRHKIWILLVLLRGRRARFNSCSEIFSFWEYSYKLLATLEVRAAWVRELNTFLIPCPLADLSIEWLQLFHQNIENGIWWFLHSWHHYKTFYIWEY